MKIKLLLLGIGALLCFSVMAHAGPQFTFVVVNGGGRQCAPAFFRPQPVCQPMFVTRPMIVFQSAPVMTRRSSWSTWSTCDDFGRNSRPSSYRVQPPVHVPVQREHAFRWRR